MVYNPLYLSKVTHPLDDAADGGGDAASLGATTMPPAIPPITTPSRACSPLEPFTDWY
jgi:hypothetical protein